MNLLIPIAAIGAAFLIMQNRRPGFTVPPAGAIPPTSSGSTSSGSTSSGGTSSRRRSTRITSRFARRRKLTRRSRSYFAALAGRLRSMAYLARLPPKAWRVSFATQAPAQTRTRKRRAAILRLTPWTSGGAYRRANAPISRR